MMLDKLKGIGSLLMLLRRIHRQGKDQGARLARVERATKSQTTKIDRLERKLDAWRKKIDYKPKEKR